MFEHLKLENSIPVVQQELIVFANAVWNGSENWLYSSSPLLRAGEAQNAVRNYRWLGSVLNNSAGEWIDISLDSLSIDSNSNYVVTWDFARPSVLGGFRIFTMKFYAHYVLSASATYFYLIEVGSWIKPTQDELRTGLFRLSRYLERNPILLHEKDLTDDYSKSLESGIELSMRVIMQYR